MADCVSEDFDLLGKLARLLASDIEAFQYFFDGFVCLPERGSISRFALCCGSERHVVRLILIFRGLNRIALNIFVVALIAGDKFLI